nr:hypothetical protein [Kibdelosporangium sp. MJ126-NF4]CTQ97655.1 hypothetical protein [Kibdelosporangium sp. MJ126-NF4]
MPGFERLARLYLERIELEREHGGEFGQLGVFGATLGRLESLSWRTRRACGHSTTVTNTARTRRIC